MTENRARSNRGTAAERHLELRGLRKEYAGEITAVEELSLSLREGELLVLVGPSGCGKSTTLRCIAGLEEPTDGDIRIAGRSVIGERPEERAIAMVFQNYALYPHKTARQNIGFGLRMTTGMSDAEVESAVEDVAGTLGITDLLEKRPKSLSGGQQQRVALGRAIVRDPEVFLLDEPLSNLDATLRARMRTEIQQLQQDLDVTTVYVTHDQTEAMTMGDRIAVLQNGQLRQVGTPMECYHEPADRFVAGFIGEPSMNVLGCRFDPGAGAFRGPIEYPATDALANAAGGAAGREVTLGIRPEAVAVGATSGSAGDAPTFGGRVDVVEPVGERSFLYVTLDAGPEMTIAVPGGVSMGERDRVPVRIPPANLHLFDTATGEALHHPDRRSEDVPLGSVRENAE
jgi:multiple sugar transport system ATP-binding protein